MRQKRFWTIALVLAVALGVQPVPVAHAAAIVVNTTDDELNSDGDCSLREAIHAANIDTAVSGCAAGDGADTITLPAGFYTLTIPGTDEENNVTGDLDITSYLTINGDGEGSTIIQAGTNNTNGIDRVLDVHAGFVVEINDVRIRYGRAPDIDDEQSGGGIRNSGILTVNTSTVSSNTAADWYGGGIYNSSTGTLTLNESTVAYNNGAHYGGGIFVFGTVTLNNSTVNDNAAVWGGGISGGGTLTMDNCTVSGNDATWGGGGISQWSDSLILALTNSTVAYNTANIDEYDWAKGGGIRAPGATAFVKNTIIGRNQDRGGEAHDCYGTLTSQGYNLLEWPDGCTIVGDTTGNIIGSNPDLGLLAANGGPTRTHALQTGSPAINHIPDGTNGCQSGVSTDQRGYPRAAGAGYGGSLCDIGAYEYDTAPPVVQFSFWLGIYVQDENGGTATITVTLNAASGNPVTVDYATSDLTATAGSDYTAVSGRLTFNPGVTSQTFTVPILDDALEEGDEWVVLTLSNPTNATIGDPNPGALVIVDDESAPPVRVYLPIILKNQ